MIRFIHTADIHFGMENYGKIDPTTGIHTRLLDFKKALNYCIDIGIQENIDFFLFSGDAYKTTHPSPTQQHLLMKCFLRLHEAKIPTIIVIGNHDNPLSFGKANALDVFGDIPSESFHVITKPELKTITTKSGPVQIIGIPWPTRNTISISKQHYLKSSTEITDYISKAVVTIIHKLVESIDTKIPAVLAGHLTVSSGIFSGSEKRAIIGRDPVLLPSHLALPQLDYVALGHLHRHQDLNKNSTPPIVYSGSIERIDFGERKEDKGFCLVTIDDQKQTSYKFIKTPARPFVQIEAHLKTNEQTNQLITEIEKHDITNAIVKIIYHLQPGKKDQVDLHAIQRACSKAHHIVGIIPIQPPEERERRTAIKVDMNLSSLLSTYFDTKEEWRNQKDTLLQKAQELESEIFDNQE